MTLLLPWEASDRLRIGTLRSRGGTTDTSFRFAVSSTLDHVDLRPAGVPPAAVLIVREMRDPLPGRLAPQQRVGGTDPLWEQAVRDRLDGFYRRAARPARDTVSTNADAVVFADEAELLACLAYDLAAGIADSKWWWRAVGRTRGPSVTGPLAPLLVVRARIVPAALSRLAGEGRAQPVLSALSADEADAVLRAVCAAFDIPDLTDTAPSLPLSAERSTAAEAVSADGVQAAAAAPPDRPSTAASRFDLREEIAPPWSVWTRTGAPIALDPARLRLLGVAVALHAQPAAVRAPRFVASARRWWSAQQAHSAVGPARAHTPQGANAGPPTGPAVAGRPRSEPFGVTGLLNHPDHAQPPIPIALDAPHSPPASPPELDKRAANLPFPSSLAPRCESGRRPPAERDSSSQAPPPAQEPHDQTESEDTGTAATTSAHPAITGPDGATQVASVPMPPREAEPGSPGPAIEGGVKTALGGVLFLINLMAALDLPDCFETEWRLASHLGPWGTLDALGRALLDPVRPEDGDDPIWLAVAALAQHKPAEPLGDGLPRRAPFRLPPTWPPTVMDVRRQSRALLRNPLLSRIDPGLRRWLSLVLPSIHLRLASALGNDPQHQAESDGPLWAPLLRTAGRLHVTLTHVDLVLPLTAASLPARLAGLDRDPGWLPGFGHIILFHFE